MLKSGKNVRVSNFDNNDTDVIDEENRTIWFIAVSDDNAGLRETWGGTKYYEEIDVESAILEVDTPFLKDHHAKADNLIGRVIETKKEDNQIKVKVRFTETDTALEKFKEGKLKSVSIGYSYDIDTADILENYRDDISKVTLKGVNIHEVSVVWQGFDEKAVMGRDKERVDDTCIVGALGADLCLYTKKLNHLSNKL